VLIRTGPARNFRCGNTRIGVQGLDDLEIKPIELQAFWGYNRLFSDFLDTVFCMNYSVYEKIWHIRTKRATSNLEVALFM
jgi:hypothetical protein